MGLLSPSVSLTRYRVEGQIEKPIIDNILSGLKNNFFAETDGESSDIMAGWTSFENPFSPNIKSDSFVFGTDFLFSLRVDKKSIPPKLIKKHYSIETARRTSVSGREYLSRNEQKEIKEHVISRLMARIPATPDLFDVIWKYERNMLFFFSTLKTANEILESLFFQSFKLPLIRIFPYTLADLGSGLKDPERDSLNQISPTDFMV